MRRKKGRYNKRRKGRSASRANASINKYRTARGGVRL